MSDAIRLPCIKCLDLTGITVGKELIEKALPYFMVHYDIRHARYKVCLKHGTRMYWSECLVPSDMLTSKNEGETREFTADSIANGLSIAIIHCLKTYLQGIEKAKGAMTNEEYVKSEILEALTKK